MKSLSNFNKEAIRLLNTNKLLKPLIQAEYIKNTLQEVIIEEELSTKITKDFLTKYKLDDEIKYQKWLKLNGLTDLDVKNTALADIRLKRYCREQFGHKVESRFLERKSQLDIYVYSMIRVKDYHKANELYLRIIEQEEDIGNLASQFSEGPESKTRGVIGPASLEIAHPILAEQLKNIKRGEVIPPIRIENVHIVCRLESNEPAKLDEVMRDKMAIELFNQSVEDHIKEINNNLINTLENNDKIEVNS